MDQVVYAGEGVCKIVRKKQQRELAARITTEKYPFIQQDLQARKDPFCSLLKMKIEHICGP